MTVKGWLIVLGFDTVLLYKAPPLQVFFALLSPLPRPRALLAATDLNNIDLLTISRNWI